MYSELVTEQLASFLGSDLLHLISDGEKLRTVSGDFYDYSFAVFPFAKAYEGYLKKLFYQIGAITKFQYESDHWRVGRALNPQLEKDSRHEESVYDHIVNYCGGTKIADIFWDAWKKGRNQIFHYFPQHYHPITKEEAVAITKEIIEAMEKGLHECKIDH